MADRAQGDRAGASGNRCRSIRFSLGVVALLGGLLSAACSAWAQASLQAQSLPDAPSALLLSLAAAHPDTPIESDPREQEAPQATAQSGVQAASPAVTSAAPQAETPAGSQTPAKPLTQTGAANKPASAALPRCPHQGLSGTILFLPGKDYGPCQKQSQLQFIVDTGPVLPLTPSQKGLLAIRGVLDPFNLMAVAAFSGITIAANSHTAYGPGFEGFGMLAGYSLVGDVQGEFIDTYAIPVLTREDPRYHRLPGKPISRRILHAIVHTYVTQHDNGSLMPNYSVLLGYPIGAEISNLYVPGLQTNGAATAERLAVEIGTDPGGALIAEFLPDIAKHIHIHVIFMQQILNEVATGSSTTPP